MTLFCFYLNSEHKNNAVIITDIFSIKFSKQYGISDKTGRLYKIILWAFQCQLHGERYKKFSKTTINQLLKKGKWTLVGFSDDSNYKLNALKIYQQSIVADEIIKYL